MDILKGILKAILVAVLIVVIPIAFVVIGMALTVIGPLAGCILIIGLPFVSIGVWIGVRQVKKNN